VQKKPFSSSCGLPFEICHNDLTSPVHRIHWSLFFLHVHMLSATPFLCKKKLTQHFFCPRLLQASWATVVILFTTPCSDVLFQDCTETPKAYHQCRLVLQVEMKSSQVVSLAHFTCSKCVKIISFPKLSWRIRCINHRLKCVSFRVVWWSMDTGLCPFATVSRFKAGDGHPLLGSSSSSSHPSLNLLNYSDMHVR
jgi:hypothetical protein